MTLYLKYMQLHFKSVLQYKTSFILSFISQFFVFFTYYFVILSLFDKFKMIKGFTIYEVLIAFSVIHFGFAFNEFFCRGIDNFHRLIIFGKYDQLLVRPRNILLQILGSEISFVKVARLFQALVVLAIAIINLNISWNYIKVICLILMLISSIVIFFSLFLFSASYCFYTIQGLEIRNAFTDGGKHASQYPIGIYKKGFALFFTFIIPYAFVNYYPLLYILERNDNVLYAFSPILVFVFFVFSLLFFNHASKRYMSSGS